MQRWIPVLLIAGFACQSSNDLLLPTNANQRQSTLSERILERALFNPSLDPGTQADVARALSEIVILGQAPRLRLVVAGDQPILAKGAAKALVKIRLAREPGRRAAVLQECIKTETNPYVKAECAAVASGKAVSPRSKDNLKQIVALMESDKVDSRRRGLRELLGTEHLWASNDEGLGHALYHCIQDLDGRVRVLTSAVFLKRSLAMDPFASEASK